MSRIRQTLALSSLVSFSYYLSEWLFFVTKASVISLLSPTEQLSILFMSMLPLFGLLVLSSLFCSFLSRRFLKGPVASFVSVLPAALILASLLFLLAENFTYTVFDFSLGSFANWRRYLYCLGFLGLIWVSARQLIVWLDTQGSTEKQKYVLHIAFLLPILAVLVCLIWFDWQKVSVSNTAAKNKKLPNIIILSTDGLRAQSMSVYGYHRKTTPFIETLAEESLVFENNFANNAKTTGSVISMLTGKLSTTTRVVFRPDILTGRHVYEHLPGLLRKLGYRNSDISVRHYVDAFDLNMRDGFDYANSRILERRKGLKLPPNLQKSYGQALFFLEETTERITSRFRHMVGLEDIRNPYEEVRVLNHSDRGTDNQRIADLKKTIKNSQKPFFVSVHLLNTHGSRFFFNEQKFSKGKEQTEGWMDDFYDDAILNYDGYVRDIVRLLKSRGDWDNTLFILSSDHGKRWSSKEPVPLIVKLPGSSRTGLVRQTTQRLDIAPTILDVLAGVVKHHNAPCTDDEWDSKTGRAVLVEHLKRSNYDVSSLDQ